MLSRRKLSGDPPETLRGGSPDILAKITGKSRENFQKKIFFAFFLKILSGFASDLAKKSGDPPRRVSGGSPDNFRRDNIAGPHGICYNLLLFLQVKKCLHLFKYVVQFHCFGSSQELTLVRTKSRWLGVLNCQILHLIYLHMKYPP